MVKKKAKRVVKRRRPMRITKELASKVLAVVDAGLSNGIGKNEPGSMCVEAAVCYAMGEPHSDRPRCVTSAIRDTKINLNDAHAWYKTGDGGPFIEESHEVYARRAKGMRRLAIAQLGSKDVITDAQWNDAIYQYQWRKLTPEVRRAYLEKVKVAKKLLDRSVYNFENGHSVTIDLEFDPLVLNTDSLLKGVKNVEDITKLCEDMVKLLIKLKSPGTKFLYLTRHAKRKK